jgi:transposase
MPFKKQNIEELLDMRAKLKEEGQISPTVDLLFDSLFTMVHYQYEQIEGLKEENELLKKRVSDLEASKKKNSKNSSLPPSKDDRRKRGSNRKSTSRVPGGQLGHKGSTLKKVSKPDVIIRHKLKGKCPCGRALSKAKKKTFKEKQVFDVEIKKVVTAHRSDVGQCSCGRIHEAEFPEGVTNNTQYGETAKTLAAYFSQYQLIPFERTQEIFHDIFDLGLCKGTVFNHLEKAAGSMTDLRSWFREVLLKSKLNHADETGVQVIKEQHHLHVVSNEQTTFLDIYKGRGKEGVEGMGVLTGYKGKLVHDCYSMYFGYPCVDVICNAHLVRELTFFCEKDQYAWANLMKEFLEKIYKNTNKMKNKGRKKRVSSEFIFIQKEYRKILRAAKKELKELINKKGRKQEKVVNLYLRMKKHEAGVLMFAKDFKVPFTNNQAERDLRMAKVHQKISGCFRSLSSAKNWALMRSYISTMKKRKIGVFDGLKALYDPSLKSPIYSILGPPG